MPARLQNHQKVSSELVKLHDIILVIHFIALINQNDDMSKHDNVIKTPINTWLYNQEELVCQHSTENQ